MGRRLGAALASVAVALALAGCGGPPKPASTVKMMPDGKTGVDQRTGVEFHTGKPQVNPNAKMPGAGSAR